MAKILKKVRIGNPLYHFNLVDEIEEYESIKTDQQLVSFFHKMWERFEHQEVITNVLSAMMSFAVGTDINKQINKML